MNWDTQIAKKAPFVKQIANVIYLYLLLYTSDAITELIIEQTETQIFIVLWPRVKYFQWVYSLQYTSVHAYIVYRMPKLK